MPDALLAALGVLGILSDTSHQSDTLQVHDRDALPQPSFVAPVLELSPKSDSAAQAVQRKGLKPPIKGPASKVPSRPVSRGKAAVLTDVTVQPAAPAAPLTEYAKPLLLVLAATWLLIVIMTACAMHRQGIRHGDSILPTCYTVFSLPKLLLWLLL